MFTPDSSVVGKQNEYFLTQDYGIDYTSAEWNAQLSKKEQRLKLKIYLNREITLIL